MKDRSCCRLTVKWNRYIKRDREKQTEIWTYKYRNRQIRGEKQRDTQTDSQTNKQIDSVPPDEICMMLHKRTKMLSKSFSANLNGNLLFTILRFCVVYMYMPLTDFFFWIIGELFIHVHQCSLLTRTNIQPSSCDLVCILR